MSWVSLMSIVVLLIAVVLIEYRAAREGDERKKHAPGYDLALVGLVMLGIGVGAAVADHTIIAVVASLGGLVAVALAARPRHRIAHP